jgi:A/G-specific adenine glycosylase
VSSLKSTDEVCASALNALILQGPPPEPAVIEEVRKRIIKWYDMHGDKYLLWRITKSGWNVLVASFLLRKTTTAQVVKIYEDFVKRYPNPQALLSARREEVEELIKPLGLERQRSKHLIELARELVNRFNGQVPCNKEKLKELPGVGDYIASEVLLLACGQPEPLLDRNMIRIIERALGVKSPKKRPHTDASLWCFAKSLIPPNTEDARKFNLGILDLGRKVCTANRPKCTACPIKELCRYYNKSRIK